MRLVNIVLFVLIPLEIPTFMHKYLLQLQAVKIYDLALTMWGFFPPSP